MKKKGYFTRVTISNFIIYKIVLSNGLPLIQKGLAQIFSPKQVRTKSASLSERMLTRKKMLQRKKEEEMMDTKPNI